MNVALCYTFSEVLWNGVSIYRNQFTFVAPSDRTRFVGDRLFYGMTELIFVVFIATWILKTLKDNEPLMLQSKNEMLIQAYSRMTKVLRLAFALKIGVQALKYLYYPTTFGYSMLFSAYGSQREISFYDLGDSYWYFEVVLPHVLDFVVLLALFLIWYPRPEFSHVDTEDSRLATLEMTPEHMGGRNNGSFAGGGSSDIGNMNTSKGGMIEMSGGVPAGTLGGLFASFTSGLTSSTSGADGRNSTGGMLSSSYSGGGSKPSIVAELDDNFDGSGNSFSSTDQNETNTSAAASTIGTSSLAPNPAAPQTGVANKFSGGISSSFGGRTGAAAARAAAKSASSMNIKSSPSKGSSSTAGSSSGTTASTGGPTQQIVGLVNMQNASSAISSSSALADALRGTASQSQHMTTRIVPAPPTEPADNSHIGFGGVVTVRSPTEPPIDAAAGGSVASGVGRATVPPPTGTGPPKKITVSARLPKKKTGAAKQEAAGRLKIDH
ncbi:unnamed protein product [Amoebophrya sp. A25]|nr:unnamed protein product [Amoebophrya sp. A25]|eukprot:GSA25T00003414001.1